MDKWISRLIAVLWSLALFIVIFSFSIESVVYNMSFYRWHYKEHNIEQDTKMTLDELMIVTEKMVDYLKDKRDTLDMEAVIDGQMQEVFGEREKSHMVDVKNMAVIMHRCMIVSVFILIISTILICIFKREWMITILSYIKFVFLSVFILVAAIGVLLVIDFDKYFTIFHQIFFTNDLWLLDPETDILINMVPEIFFFTTAMLVIVVFAIFTTLAITLAQIIKKQIKVKIGE